MEKIRLDKLLANSGFGTRKNVKTMIKKGWVSIDNEVITTQDYRVDLENQKVKVEDKIVKYEKYIYILLNKPKGVISATKDRNYKTVIDLVFDEYGYKDLFPIGRLDIDTTGLLLITNDGELSHDLKSPKKEVEKVYEVIHEKELDKKDIDKLQNGVVIDNNYKTKKAKIEIIDKNKSLIAISEGKYHQVKQMYEVVNNKVLELKRIKFANLNLKDYNLKEGQYIKIDKKEIVYNEREKDSL